MTDVTNNLKIDKYESCYLSTLPFFLNYKISKLSLWKAFFTEMNKKFSELHFHHGRIT